MESPNATGFLIVNHEAPTAWIDIVPERWIAADPPTLLPAVRDESMRRDTLNSTVAHSGVH